MLYYLCLSACVVFAILFAYHMASMERKHHPRRLERAIKRFDATLQKCMEANDYRLPEKAIKRMKNVIGLEAFYYACQKLDESDRRRFVTENFKPFRRLQNLEHNPTIHAFFAYMLFKLNIGSSLAIYTPLLFSFLKEPCIYARENALKNIYCIGDSEPVVNALTDLSADGISHNEKLVYDGLLTFTGDKEELADRLMQHYEELLECYRNSLINYLGYYGIDRFDDYLIERTRVEGASVDVICCIIRKLSKTVSDRNLRFLEEIISRFRVGDVWEPVAVAVTGLGKYQNEEARHLLIEELTSRNWFVRKNAAAALVSVGISESDIAEIESRNDKYAMEAIRFEMGRRKNA